MPTVRNVPRAVLLFLACTTLRASPAIAATDDTPATNTPQGPAVPTYSSVVRQVVLDVVVMDKHGHSVTGLHPADFVLSEDGVRQSVTTVLERDALPDSTPAPALPANTFADHPPIANDVEMTAIVFDTSNVDWPSGYYARYEVAQYLKKVHPGTPLCVFKLDPQGLQLIQDFTTDTQGLKKAVESKRNAQWPQLSPVYARSARAIALRELAKYLSSFPGRKNLIWFGGTGGPQSPYDDPQDVETFKQDLEGITDTLRLNSVALYQVDPRGLVTDPEEWEFVTTKESEIAKTVTATGGHAFYGNNGLKQIVDRVVAAGSHYYTVSYTPSNTVWYGAYRKIQVEIANQSGKYLATQTGPAEGPFHLEYRTGYFAHPSRTNLPGQSAGRKRLPMPANRRRLSSITGPGSTTTPQDRAVWFGSIPPFQVLFRVHITPATHTDKVAKSETPPRNNFLEANWLHKTYRNYTLEYSFDPNQIQFTEQDGVYIAAVQFLAVVYDENGRLANSLVTRADISFNKDQYVAATRNGMALTQKIAVPAHGEFWLRIAVHDLASGRVGALEVPVSQIQLQPQQSAANAVAVPHR